MADQPLYRINFVNQGKVYELYVREVSQSSLYGFVEIGDFVFGENSTLVLDPSEERLKDEFGGVERSYIPMQAVIRIDAVKKQGTAKIRDMDSDGGNVMAFPGALTPPGNDSGSR